MTQYRGIEVYKLQPWSQGPVMLQALIILEGFDLKAMGYNSARYIHTLYQTMSLATDPERRRQLDDAIAEVETRQP